MLGQNKWRLVSNKGRKHLEGVISTHSDKSESIIIGPDPSREHFFAPLGSLSCYIKTQCRTLGVIFDNKLISWKLDLSFLLVFFGVSVIHTSLVIITVTLWTRTGMDLVQPGPIRDTVLMCVPVWSWTAQTGFSCDQALLPAAGSVVVFW